MVTKKSLKKGYHREICREKSAPLTRFITNKAQKAENPHTLHSRIPRLALLSILPAIESQF
jgi:hypothetical protein